MQLCVRLLGDDNIENSGCLDTSYMREREKRRDELTQAQGLIQEQERKKKEKKKKGKKKRGKKTPSPSCSRPANQHAEELVYLETKDSVCSDVTSSAAH